MFPATLAATVFLFTIIDWSSASVIHKQRQERFADANREIIFPAADAPTLPRRAPGVSPGGDRVFFPETTKGAAPNPRKDLNPAQPEPALAKSSIVMPESTPNAALIPTTTNEPANDSLSPVQRSEVNGCNVTMEEVYFRGRCYQILKEGPCETGEIVAYNSTTNDLECIVDFCSTPGFVYWPANQTCIPYDNRACGREKEILIKNKYGVGECLCLEGYVRWESTGQCYETHRKGPCDEGQILVLNRTEESMEFFVACQTNPCTTDDELLFQEQCYNRTDVPQELCDSGFIDIDYRTMQPVCSEGLLQKTAGRYNRLSCPTGFTRDFNDICRKPFNGGRLMACQKGYKLTTNAPEPETPLDPIHGCKTEWGEVYFQNECHRILEKGPCPSEHILAFDRNTHKLICKAESETNMKTSDVKCRQHEFPVVNVYAETECQCQPGYGRINGEGPCYQAFTRGPCDEGSIVTLTDEAGVHCSPNVCPSEGLVMYNDECQERGSQIACIEGGRGRLDISRETWQPQCSGTGMRAALRGSVFDCPPGSKRDYSGRCRKPFGL